MVLDMVLSKDKSYLYTASVDADARSWILELSREAKVFEGANRSVTCLYQKGYICKWLLQKYPSAEFFGKMFKVCFICLVRDGLLCLGFILTRMTRGPFLTSSLAPRSEISLLRQMFTPSFTPGVNTL
jgi:hypothetical protein